MDFLCSQCGACCRSVGKTNAKIYGLPIKKDGSCRNLVGNICSIYETRPDICRVDSMLTKKPGQTKKEYFIEQTKNCHILIDNYGLDSSYKINIKQYDV